MGSPIVLVFGGDLGFVLALAHELSNRNLITIPVRTARDARSLTTRFRLNPDVLVIDCSIPDASSFAEQIMKERPEVKIIGIISDSYDCKKLANQLVATFRDPDETGPELICYCASVIERLLRA